MPREPAGRALWRADFVVRTAGVLVTAGVALAVFHLRAESRIPHFVWPFLAVTGAALVLALRGRARLRGHARERDTAPAP